MSKLKQSANRNFVKEKKREMYIIRSNDGKYYNGADNEFYYHLGNCTFASSHAEARGFVNYYKLENVEILTVGEDLFVQEKAHLFSQLLIMLESVNQKLTTDVKTSIAHWKNGRGLKKKVNDLIGELKSINEEFNYFCTIEEDNIYDVQGQYMRFIHYISKEEFRNIEVFADIAEATSKDYNAVMGIVKKINSKKK